MYISEQVVDFRHDALTQDEMIEKFDRMAKQMEEQTGRSIVYLDTQGIAIPILICEQGARKRGLDLEIAAADAKDWRDTGLVPLRPLPILIREEEVPPYFWTQLCLDNGVHLSGELEELHRASSALGVSQGTGTVPESKCAYGCSLYSSHDR